MAKRKNRKPRPPKWRKPGPSRPRRTIAREQVGCSSGKLAWERRRDAVAFTERFERLYGGRLWVYRCPECGYLHTTSQDQS